MKTYVITVSRNFPVKHPRAGQPTYFVDQIESTIYCTDKCGGECNICSCRHFIELKKIHTIRANYDLWKKRIDEVNAGNAVLSIRYWSGNPYRSKQVEICRLTKEDGTGIQAIKMVDHGNFTYIQISNDDEKPLLHSDCVDYDWMRSDIFLVNRICKNDGLSYEDFKAWFKGYDLSKPMAIIQFTKFRY